MSDDNTPDAPHELEDQIVPFGPKEPFDDLRVTEKFQLAISSGDLATASESGFTLWDKRSDLAVACMRMGDVSSAGIAAFRSVEHLPELLDRVDRAIASGGFGADDHAELVKVAARIREVQSGWLFVGYLWRGLGQMLGGAFDDAKTTFADARTVVQRNPSEDSHGELVNFCNAYETACEGYSQMRRFNFSMAAKQLMKARASLGEVSGLAMAPSSEVPTDVISGSIDLDTARLELESAYHIAVYQDRVANDDPEDALKNITEAIALQEETLKKLAQMDTADAMPWLAKLKAALLHQLRAQRSLIEAQVRRENREYSEATRCYQEARKHYERAAMAYLASGLPQAQPMQDSLYNQMSGVRLMQRQCDEEERLVNEVRSLEKDRAEVMTMISKNLGTHFQFTNTNELKAALNQQMNVTARNVRVGLEEFLTQLSESGLNDATKDTIARQTKDVLASEPQTMVDRVAAWGEKVASILGPLGEAGSKLLPYLQIVLAATGHPVSV